LDSQSAETNEPGLAPRNPDTIQPPSVPGGRPPDSPRTEASRLGRNFTAIAIAQFLAQILALVISVTLARTLGVSAYGVFVFGFAFPNWFLILVGLGLDSVITIDVAADRSRAPHYLTAVGLLRLPLLVGTLIALWITVGFALADPTARLVTFLLGTSTIVSQFSQMFPSIFRAFERLEYVALTSVLAQIITTVAVLGLLLSGAGLVPVSVAYLVISILIMAFSMVLCYRRFAWFAPRASKALMGKILRKTAPFGLADVMGTFLGYGAPVLLTLLASSIATGIFNAAFSITNALRAPLALYSVAALPAMARFHGSEKEKLAITVQKSQKIFFILALPLALGGWYYREAIMTLFYGSAFFGSGDSFGILVFTVATSAAALAASAALAAIGRQTINLMIGMLGAGLNLGLDVLLIPAMGPTGAAWAFLVASVVMATATLIVVARFGVKIDLVEILLRPCAAGGVMLLALYFLPIPHLYVGIAIGGLVYFVTLVLIRGIGRDDWDLVKQIVRGGLFR
jgi:O-antigen/teichoic acid export membrane protein